MNRLEGKTAIITGGGTGIGLASAKRFIEEGAFVYIFGRRREKLDAAVATLGANARAVVGSVTDAGDLDRLFDTVKQERSTLDILFANAGTGALVPLTDITPEHYGETFDINVKGTIFTVQKGLKLMGQGGSVILTGSTTGVMGTCVQHLQRVKGRCSQPRAQLGARSARYGYSRQRSIAWTNADRTGGRGCWSRRDDRDGLYHADRARRRTVRGRGGRRVPSIVG